MEMNGADEEGRPLAAINALQCTLQRHVPTTTNHHTRTGERSFDDYQYTNSIHI
jgi:hypothetical protein